MNGIQSTVRDDGAAGYVDGVCRRREEGRERVGRIEKHASHASTPRHIALGGSQIVAEQQNRQTIVSCSSNLTRLMRGGLNKVVALNECTRKWSDKGLGKKQITWPKI